MKRSPRWLTLVLGLGLAAPGLILPACGRDSGPSAKVAPHEEAVTLFIFSAGEEEPVERSGSIPRTSVIAEKVKSLIEVMGQGREEVPALPTLAVRSAFMRGNGLLLLDFEKGVKYNHFTVMEEMAVLRSLVLTITKNIPEIASVKIIVGGVEEETFSGHIDISKPFTAENTAW